VSTIVDLQIRHLCKMSGLVEPFNPEMVNPASIDVTLGSTILREGGAGEERWVEVDIENGVYSLAPGEFVLAATQELIRVPANLECVFNLKSSRGREGYQHLLAAYIDPGFHGRVTLELVNVNRYHRLPLEHGMRIGQLRFAKVDEIPMRTYASTGRYQGDQGVQASKG
jgi:dCTP deaminase